VQMFFWTKTGRFS